MTGRRRCYLHVGTPKSGTSYLQSVFWSSRDQLADQGLYLPLTGVDHFFITLALRGLLDEKMDPPSAFDVLDRLAASLAAAQAPRTLISHELLAPVGPEQATRLHDLLEAFEVHLIIPARDLARQIPAEWQQHVKQRKELSYDEFLAAVTERAPDAEHFWAVQDVPDVAARWGSRLPPERVHIVTVPRAGSPPAVLLERFCSVVGVRPEVLDTTSAHGNPSLGVAQAELLRRVNVALGERLPHPRAGYGRVVKRYLADQVLAPQGGQPPRLPSRLADWCRDVSTQMVERLTAAGYDVVGNLDDLIPADQGPIPDAVVTDAEIAAAATQALAALLDQRHRDLDRLAALEREVAEQAEELSRQAARIAELERDGASPQAKFASRLARLLLPRGAAGSGRR